jgi:uncharacterized protein
MRRCLYSASIRRILHECPIENDELAEVNNALRPARIWVLKGLRAGDSAQAVDLAMRIGGDVDTRQLSFNRLHVIPNWLGGATTRAITVASRSALQPPWPDLVIATGKRTAAVALWIKQQSKGTTVIVQLGRPQMNLSLFDLVVTTPQYGLPAAPNVVEVPLPFGAAKQISDADLLAFKSEWSRLPRPWTMAVIGAAKHPLVMGKTELDGFARALAPQSSGSILLFDSPRSKPGALQHVAKQLGKNCFCPPKETLRSAYAAALYVCDALVVTSDSMSMVSDMLATGKPTSVYRLPKSPFAVHWSAKSGLAEILARRGVLMPPRNMAAVIDQLIAKGVLGDVVSGQKPKRSLEMAEAYTKVVERIRSLLRTSFS